MSDLVLRENHHGAAILTLNRPDKMNALNKDVFEALEPHVDSIARETRKIGLVVLRGAGGNFSSGYDMVEVLEHVKAHAKPHYHSEVIEKIANRLIREVDGVNRVALDVTSKPPGTIEWE